MPLQIIFDPGSISAFNYCVWKHITRVYSDVKSALIYIDMLFMKMSYKNLGKLERFSVGIVCFRHLMN